MTKKRSYLISPLVVMVIMMSVFFSYHMFPFGNNTLSWCDMKQQVIPLLMDFKDILAGKASMFLNLQNAGGMSFWSVFLFYLSSPFNFLVALVSKADMYRFVNILVMLKMMTCALTAGLFFGKRFYKLNILQNVSLSVMYAFCGYAMFYYQNHWLDVMYLFPILLLGLIQLAEEERVWLFILSFSAILIVNFYLSYMIVIFLILSAGIYFVIVAPRERRKKIILLLCVSTVIVAFITSFVWLPSLIQYVHSARTGDIITSLKSGDIFTRFDTTLTVILCTGAIFSAVIMYLGFSIQYTKKSICIFCIFLATLVPVFIEPINKMWNTGNYQAFPVRYGFITIFFGIMLLASIFSDMNQRKQALHSKPIPLFASMLAISALFTAACVLIQKDYETITAYTRTLWGDSDSFSLLFAFSLTAGLAYLIIILFCQYKQLGKMTFCVLFCLLVVIECVFNSCVYIASTASNASAYQTAIQLSGKINDNDLYRVKTDKKYFDVNLVGSLGYNTLSHYTSLTSESFMYSMKNLGYSSYWMEVNSNGGTALTDAILGNKYCIVKTDEIQSADPIIFKNSDYAIQQNDSTLPVGFVFESSDVQSLSELPDTTRFNMQESLFQRLFHTNKKLFTIYEPAEYDNAVLVHNSKYRVSFPDPSLSGMITYNIPVKGTQILYFDCFDLLSNSLVEHINSSFDIYVNGRLVQAEFPSQSNNGILNLGTFTDENVQIQVEVLKEFSGKSFGVAGLDKNILSSAIRDVKSAQLKQEGNKIAGSAYAANQESYLFLPINYDSGYSAQINGKQTSIVQVFDSMMAVKLEKGENKVSIKYVPPGLGIGLCISILGILLFILFFIFLKKGLYDKIKFLETPVLALFWLLCIAVFFAIYIFPLIIYF